MILTTAEAAEMIGVSPARVRVLVHEGRLRRPLRESEVVEFELAHRKRRRSVATLAAKWREMLESRDENEHTVGGYECPQAPKR